MEERFNISLTQAELNTVLAAMADMPFKVAQPIINRIVEDFNAQQPEVELE